VAENKSYDTWAEIIQPHVCINILTIFSLKRVIESGQIVLEWH